MSPILPLLMPTPNQIGEFGEMRNCWMLNFNCKDKDLFFFFGVIIGHAIRNSSALRLDLHPIVWK
jgi:hypothetical protein